VSRLQVDAQKDKNRRIRTSLTHTPDERSYWNVI
jgi:hypothetical protein